MTYVCLVLSIGLLVDFNVHILLRYYESKETTREAKVKDTLCTMGSSLFVGALSTCLGVIPLAFSTSGILKTVFVSFIAMVTLGIGHGVILLPVVLSICGPVSCVGVDSAVGLKERVVGDIEEENIDESPNLAAVVAVPRFCVQDKNEEGLPIADEDEDEDEEYKPIEVAVVSPDTAMGSDDEGNLQESFEPVEVAMIPPSEDTPAATDEGVGGCNRKDNDKENAIPSEGDRQF